MIGFTARAARQFQQLLQHYEDRERLEAIRWLIAAVEEGSRQIETDVHVGLPAPRPYPHLARPGRAWIKVRSYWICYSMVSAPVIIAVFRETADIPVDCSPAYPPLNVPPLGKPFGGSRPAWARSPIQSRKAVSVRVVSPRRQVSPSARRTPLASGMPPATS